MRRLMASLLAATLFGCGGGGDGGGGGSSEDDRYVGGENGAGTLLDLAHAVYAALGTEEAAVAIAGAHVALGIPLVAEEEVEGLDPRQPFLLEPQLLDLVAAFEQGTLVSVDSFFADLAEMGARVQGEPLSRASFARAFGHYAKADRFGEDEALLGFVFALARARAELLGLEEVDPLWGDGGLDPLQFSLLAQAFAAAEPDAAAPTQQVRSALEADDARADRIRKWGAGKLRGFVAGKLEKLLQMPLTPWGGVKASVCASLLIYGHKLEVKVEPDLIWHKQEGGDKPALAQVQVRLRFQDDYYSRDYPKSQRWVLEKGTGCNLPRPGPAPGKPLTWKTGARLQAHGAYDIQPSRTDDRGEAVATWRSVEEKTPPEERTPENLMTVADRLYVEVRDLVPGWKNLERSVAFTAGDNALYEDDSLTVNWYQRPCSPGANLASLSECAWVGTSRVTTEIGIAPVTIRADVRFAYKSHDERTKRVVFVPVYGTAFEEGGHCSKTRTRSNIGSRDGELIVDYSVDPPRYEGRGLTQWSTEVRCQGQSFAGNGGGVWFSTYLGGSEAFVVGDDGKRIASNGASGMYRWEWEFRRR